MGIAFAPPILSAEIQASVASRIVHAEAEFAETSELEAPPSAVEMKSSLGNCRRCSKGIGYA